MRTIQALLVLSTLTACGQAIRGNGERITEIREVSASTGVDVAGFYTVTVETGADTDTVEVFCDENLLPYILTDVRNGMLSLRTQSGFNLSTRGECSMVVRLSRSPEALHVSGSGSLDIEAALPELRDASVAGSGELVLTRSTEVCDLDASVAGSGELWLGELDGCSLDIAISGSGEVMGSGSIDRLDASLSGSGDLYLRDMTTSSAEIRIAGSGGGELSVSDYLEATISGSGTLDVYGAPDSDVSTTGSGDVRFR